MQNLNTLWKIASAASEVAELARSSDTYRFNVEGEITFFLHTHHAEVRVTRWTEARIEVVAQLQAPFGWRVETDQDDAGVYFVARRRPVVGGLSGAVFAVSIPATTYLVLKLEQGRLLLDNLSGTVNVPPPARTGEIQINQEKL